MNGDSNLHQPSRPVMAFDSAVALVLAGPAFLAACLSTPVPAAPPPKPPEPGPPPPEASPAARQPPITALDLCDIEWSVDATAGVPRTKVVCESTTAYFETIETSPNVQSVTRVTDFEGTNGQIGGAVVSRHDDLYYWFIEDKNAESPRGNLWRKPVVGTGRTRITSGPGFDLHPSLSARGSAMIFASDRTGGRSSLWRINARGGSGLTRVTSTSAAEYAPSLSPDEALVAYESRAANSSPQIWTVDLRTGSLSQLRQGQRPRISPDARTILFSRRNSVTGRHEIWQMDVSGGGETFLSGGPDHDEIHPTWSPDGKSILYASNQGIDGRRRQNYDIWHMAIARGTRTQLTTNGSRDDEPFWHEDGRIFFRSNRGGTWNIWYMRTVGVS